MKLKGLRVLMCHNRYRITGGEDVSARAEAELLSEAGAEVECYEVTNDAIPDCPGLRYGFRTIWSHEAYQEVRNRLRAGGHHVVHVQNFFPLLSPAVFWAARKEGAAVVAALRNYRMGCLNGLFFREGRVCEDCLGTSPLPGLRQRCYRGSLAASASVAGMIVAHRGLGTWRRAVDVFVVPSAFAMAKLAEAGVPASRIVVKPNFVHPDPGPGPGDGGFVLYAGRLSAEKGIGILLEAWRKLRGEPKLVVVGRGPLEEEVRRVGGEGIEYLGGASPAEVLTLMAKAALVVVPSVWYETFGRVVAEAFAVGTPVVASAIGPLTEMVDPGRNGLLVPAGDAEALASAVRQLFSSPRVLRAMREGARRVYEAHYTGEQNIRLLSEIYREAMQRARA